MKTNVIEKLVERYTSKPKSQWDEAQIRNSLLNPFWKALGWDINDPTQVEVERRVNIREHIKFADYAFLEDGKIHFLVEAKSPAHNLIRDRDAIFQLKRYIWNTPRVYLGILQDFEEFLPIIVLKEPNINFPNVGLLKNRYMKYTEYIDRWDELVELYSREAVIGGSLEKLLPQKTKLEKVTEPVDRKFFSRLMEWRKEIAASIARRNPEITDDRLNEVVNDLLNRLLFIRVIEDREIEPSEILYPEWKKWQREQRGSLWAYILDIFAKLNPKYNGTMFLKHSEDPLQKIIIDDRPLNNLIKNLYYPSPYQFSILPVEIIGNAYEKYLGYVLRTTPKRFVKLEEKPEVRKAGGVYYTPKYIVDYIVEQTVGRLLEDKKPNDVRKIKILDPACGSGSFLIGAYERIMKYYIDYYTKHPKENKGFVVKTPEGGKKLSLQLKKQILRDNIYGVDIDRRAVEITEFSLYVKMMEGEQFRSLFGEAILPDLRDNIKCGNSLIGWDILDMGILPDDIDERNEILAKINPMNWEDAFPEVFGNAPSSVPIASEHLLPEGEGRKPSPHGRGRAEGAGEGSSGGFDVVIGNPPYLGGRFLDRIFKNYCSNVYLTAHGQYDIYAIFIEKGIRILKSNGKFGYIVPDAMLDRSSAKSLRNYILNNVRIKTITKTSGVFKNANVSNIVLVLEKGIPCGSVEFRITDKTHMIQDGMFIKNKINQNLFRMLPKYSFLNVTNDVIKCINKIVFNSLKLIELTWMARGEEIGKKEAYLQNSKKGNNNPILFGENVKRYSIIAPTKFIPYKEIKKNKKTYGPKIVVRQLGDRINAAIDKNGKYVTVQAVYSIVNESDFSILFLLGVINSKVIDFIYRNIYRSKAMFPRIILENLKELPIPNMNLSNPSDKAKHDRMVKLVDDMLALNKKLHETTDEKMKHIIQKQIEITDKKIDALVYELYGLTEEEIKVVEEKGNLN